MAAGTAVMHFPSPRSTVKKEEPARRIQKIKADEVRIVTECKGWKQFRFEGKKLKS